MKSSSSPVSSSIGSGLGESGGVRASVPHWLVTWGLDLGRVGGRVRLFLLFFLGVVILEFRHGVVGGRRGAVHPECFVFSLVDFGVIDSLTTGSDHRDRVRGL